MNDCVVCTVCLRFKTVDSPFVSVGFKNWKKAVEKRNGYLDQHLNSEGHKMTCVKANSFISTHQIGTDISSLSMQVAAQQHRTKQGNLSIIYIIISLGQ